MADLMKEWLADRVVLAYRFADFTRPSVDAWVADLTAEMNAWELSKPLRILLDARASGKIVTPYAIMKARSMTNVRPELSVGRTAILVGSRYGAQAISNALQFLTNNRRERRLFSDEQSAMTWLLAPTFAAGRRALDPQR